MLKKNDLSEVAVPATSSATKRQLPAASLAAGAVAVLVSIATPALANRLDGDDIRRAVTGKRIYLATPLGGEFPLFYRPDGRVDGTGEALGIGRWVRPTDSGKWWVAGDRLCQQWQTWYDGKVMCFTLTRVEGGKLRWVQDNGDTGLARIAD